MKEYKDTLENTVFDISEEVYNDNEKVRILKEGYAHCKKHKKDIFLKASDGDIDTLHDSSVCMFCLEEFLASDKWNKIKEEFSKDEVNE